VEQAVGTRATAFGLDIECDGALTFLDGACAAPTGRTISISVCPDETAAETWPDTGSVICDERTPDDGVNFRIETHPDTGFLIWGPEYGAHLLSADGRRLRCFPEGQAEGAWQRLLVAQVLPFAALLHGLEVFHASAVVRDGEAVAFLGPSRSGKTSLALELCSRGATFLADDVLALEPHDGRLIANPGSPIAGVDRNGAHEHQQTDADERVVAVNARERMVRMRAAGEPAPLGMLFFIDRRADGPEIPSFAPSTDAQLLLAATFNFVLATPERLRGLLDVCALAARLRVERISSGPATSTSELADAVGLRMNVSR
jgi:hypothetical protein